MIIRVFNDIHVDGVSPVMTHERLIQNISESPYPVLLNGDVHDLVNCTKSRVDFIRQAIKLTRNYVLSKGGWYNSGNHDGLYDKDIMSWVTQDVLSIHGDLAMWPYAKAMAFRQQTPGAGWFKRNVISRVIDKLRHLLTVRPNKRLKAFIEKVKAAHPSLRVVIISHSHPSSHVFFTHAGVNGVILMRGMHNVEVKDDYLINVKTVIGV